MDLAHLRAHPERLPTYLFHQRIRETPVGGGSICQARRLTLEDGSSLFAKSRENAPAGFFEAEAAGLRWLGEAPGGAPVPEVIAALPDLLALGWVEPGEPAPAAAERFGRELAQTHRAGAEAFGAPWPGFIGSLPQDNTVDTAVAGAGWAEWFATRRLEPYLRLAAERGAVTGADMKAVRSLIDRIDQHAPPAEPPARLHGDLWPGNVLWGAQGRVWLVDPAAQGGHRETDVAQLSLFGGAPLLSRILDAYDEAWPLADGWRDRVPLHQLHLLLVHAALFGASYRPLVMAALAALR
jgi:fructosamine-3-kinase